MSLLKNGGTEEEKKQLKERRERMQEFLKDIQVLTVEDAYKRMMENSVNGRNS